MFYKLNVTEYINLLQLTTRLYTSLYSLHRSKYVLLYLQILFIDFNSRCVFWFIVTCCMYLYYVLVFSISLKKWFVCLISNICNSSLSL